MLTELHQGEGCQVRGRLVVKRVASTLHFGVTAFSSYLLGQVSVPGLPCWPADSRPGIPRERFALHGWLQCQRSQAPASSCCCCCCQSRVLLPCCATPPPSRCLPALGPSTSATRSSFSTLGRISRVGSTRWTGCQEQSVSERPRASSSTFFRSAPALLSIRDCGAACLHGAGRALTPFSFTCTGGPDRLPGNALELGRPDQPVRADRSVHHCPPGPRAGGLASTRVISRPLAEYFMPTTVTDFKDLSKVRQADASLQTHRHEPCVRQHPSMGNGAVHTPADDIAVCTLGGT